MALRVRYQTIEFDTLDIHPRTLRDRQEFEDVDGVAEALGINSATWPLFGVVWHSSRVLAELMLDFDIKGKRILEIGCGIGLASLILNHRQADITATDHHPSAAKFLAENVELNSGRAIPFVRTGWNDISSALGEFDLLIGSDILYERMHVDMLDRFIQRHAAPACEVVIVDPGRGHHAQFTKRLKARDYCCNKTRAEPAEYLPDNYRGQILHYTRRDHAKVN